MLASLAGAGGLGSILLLATIVAGAVWLLEAVGSAAEERSDRFPVAMRTAGLACVVAAATAHVPLVAAGLLVSIGLELLGEVGGRRESASEPRELVELPASRAA